MRFAEGGDLARRLRTTPQLEPLEAARVTRDLARGLEHMHDQGVLHRDLKPGNVLFDKAGTPMLVDLGIAKLMGEESLTISGDILGTPSYMSAEQILGQRAKLGPRADVYSLGVLLFRMLCGQLPFRAKNLVQLVTTVATAPAPDPRDFAPEVPDALAELCLQLLEKEPEARMSARELGARLDRILHGEPVVVSEPSRVPRLAVLGGVLLGLGLGLGAVGFGRGEPPPPPAVVSDAEVEAPRAVGFPFDLAPGPLGRYALQADSSAEWAHWEDDVTKLEVACTLELKLEVSAVRGTSATVEATVEGLRLSWEFSSAMLPGAMDPMRFDSSRELDREHPLLRAKGKRFGFQLDLRSGAVEDVSGLTEIQAAILAELGMQEAARHRVPLFDPEVMRDALGALLHVLPGDAQLPEEWTLERRFADALGVDGTSGGAQGPTLDVPKVEVRYARDRDAVGGRLSVEGSGRQEASRDDVRWAPLDARNAGELEFDLASSQEQSSRLSWSRGRLESATFGQRWQKVRVYALTAAPERTHGRAVSFGRDSLSLRWIGD